MDAVPSEAFLQWVSQVGIGFDSGYPDSGCLRLAPPRDHARFWVLPLDPGTWPHFVASALGGLDKWETSFLWPRSGGWPHSGRSASAHQGDRKEVLWAAGIPSGWAGAVRLHRGEQDTLIAVLCSSLAFGWCVDDDLFFVPDHGQQLVQTDHHDVIHVECASEARVQALVRHMAAAGYELPTEPPDPTFRYPRWMG